MHGEDLAGHGPPREVEPELLLQEFGGDGEAVVAQVSRRPRFVAADHAQGHEAFENGRQHTPAMWNGPFGVGVDFGRALQDDVRERERREDSKLVRMLTLQVCRA